MPTLAGSPIRRVRFTYNAPEGALDHMVTMQDRIDQLEEERRNFILALQERDSVIQTLLKQVIA